MDKQAAEPLTASKIDHCYRLPKRMVQSRTLWNDEKGELPRPYPMYGTLPSKPDFVDRERLCSRYENLLLPFDMVYIVRRPLAAAMAQQSPNLDTPAMPADYKTIRGIRLVRPYFFDFRCNVKGRWIGMGMLDVFREEFSARNTAYYEEAFADGRLRVAGGGVGLHDPLKGGMVMQHYIHRHEPPVLDIAIPILGQAEDVVAVGKPASMPVHVSGQYRKNTLLGILEAEHPELGKLFPVHRLDKSVSGVLLFARSAPAAERVRQLIQGSSVEKAYIARVLGVFPEQPVSAKAGLAWDPKYNHVSAVDEGVVTDVSGREAKPSHTDFQRLAVAPDGRTSLVKCWPRTGRTHQIRVHLQYLGHPIANDMQYGGTYRGPRPPFLIPNTAAAEKLQKASKERRQQMGIMDISEKDGQDKLKTAASTELLVTSASLQFEANSVQPSATLPPSALPVTPNESMDLQNGKEHAGGQSHDRKANSQSGSSEAIGSEPEARSQWLEELQVEDVDNDSLCINCPKWSPKGYPIDLTPMWLHAMEYSSSAWSFKCPPPPWSLEEWVPE